MMKGPHIFPYHFQTCILKITRPWGAWVAQSVEHPTLAHAMILEFVSSSPMSGSVPTAQSLEPASDSVSPPLSAPPPLTLCLSVSLSLSLSLSLSQKQTLKKLRGAWVAQLVEHLTSAQVTVSRITSSSPASGSVLTARSLEPASDSASPSLSAPPPLALCFSKMNKC